MPCRDTIIKKGNQLKIISKNIDSECHEHVFTIRWNGKIQMCCRSRLEEGVIGDAATISLNNLKNTEMFKKQLVKLRNRKYISYCNYCS